MGRFDHTGFLCFSSFRVGEALGMGCRQASTSSSMSLIGPVHCRTYARPGHDRLTVHRLSGRGNVDRSRPFDPAALCWLIPSSERTSESGAKGSSNLDYCCKALLGEWRSSSPSFRANDRGIG